ncbi:DUF2892 domain-containing protein [Marinoscillum sp. MHG1-6]|uniref:YgaP family membrane protein n=1 Tax=Marinoscillum sp. MHG1-6 TaxID=2959627 RepID=UPI0021571131|nr:DUF2892 domain-containing protein [Marinoscillum sp. MHG1-6]
MKKNMGPSDRIIRLILAIAMTVLYSQNVITGAVGIALLALSAIFVLTSLLSYCPIYALFGVKTCKTSS